ncbi:ATP-dependent DNA helicase Q-like SIM [Camellia lanceoleosa]|uniref:ATP-dependent DNA helicase Q-like SIM n=1 Tax=Camellia lanceoleosa TaxID=1840588 RepID=A0ACC0IY19_9ERIC|nr:ATP-dependent DNA helicase Q-like SIM [Camellia lanceoleosa]
MAANMKISVLHSTTRDRLITDSMSIVDGNWTRFNTTRVDCMKEVSILGFESIDEALKTFHFFDGLNHPNLPTVYGLEEAGDGDGSKAHVIIDRLPPVRVKKWLNHKSGKWVMWSLNSSGDQFLEMEEKHQQLFKSKFLLILENFSEQDADSFEEYMILDLEVEEGGGGGGGKQREKKQLEKAMFEGILVDIPFATFFLSKLKQKVLALHPFQRTNTQQICAQFFDWPPEKTVSCGEFFGQSPDKDSDICGLREINDPPNKREEGLKLQQGHLEGSTIIYVPTRKETLSISKFLCKCGVKAAAYNAKAAMEERHRANQLAQQLEDNKRRIEELQKEILELVSSRTLVEALAVLPDKNMNSETAIMKLQRKKLKFKKKQVKHAKKVEFEIYRNNILQQELCCLRQGFVQFSHRLDVLNNYFSHRGEGSDDLVQ